MNRRNFIKLLGTIPALAFLKPKVSETSLEGFIESSESEEARPVVEATQSSLVIGPENSLYLGGAFSEYRARWNDIDETWIDYRDYYQPTNLSRMDDSGLWESTDGGKTWKLTIST